MEKVILDLCGGTGAWSKPYRSHGYTVHTITLPYYDVNQTSLPVNHMLHFEGMNSLLVHVDSVHGILAAPPCTHFSFARTRAKTPRDMAGAMQTVESCMWIVKQCRLYGNLKWWALENPTGYLRQLLGLPGYKFQQWEFGGKFMKPTDLWGYFNPPIKTVKKRPKNVGSFNRDKAHTHPRIPQNLKHLSIREARAAVRAITPEGFANAFFKANP